ncbi:MAG TPA: polysaccharide biosynthesis tyrosine autokinase, partial [Dongiaceae bacterium]|nr:polysaccharide biosynthesis tyrosine autokinase [Dongiaceae bacterium]
MYANTRHTETLLDANIIDVRHYWSVLLHNKWWILGMGVVIAALAGLVATRIEPIYRATNTVLIENADTKVTTIDDLYGLNTRAKEYYLTQYEILKSRELAEALIKRLSLETHPVFDPRQNAAFDWHDLIPSWLDILNQWFPRDTAPLTEEQIKAQVLSRFTSALEVEPINNTQLVRINFDANDPALAAQIANEMADVYIESNLDARLQMTKKAAGWLTGRLEELSNRLKESEAKLQEYREKETLVEMGGVNTLNARELDELTLRYVAANNARSQAQNLLDQVRSTGSWASTEQMLQLPAIQSHDLVKSLRTAQVQADLKVAELSKRYGPRHPTMVAARAEADKARDELDQQIQRIARGIETDFQSAKETERAVASQLSRAKQDAQSVNRKEFRLSELQREVDTNRQLYDMFLSRAKEIGEAGGLQMAHARVVDPAQVPRVPVAPKTDLIMILALLASLGLGVLLAFVRDALDNTVKTPEDVEEKLNTRLLGFLPRTKSRSRQLPVEGFLSANFSRFAEAVRSLRTDIMLSSIDQPHKVVLVTSSLPSEGKSTVALNLAEALGQMEKVLLIEADLRKPVMARALKIPLDTPGLSTLVSGQSELKACITSLPERGIDVMVAGALPGNPQELLSSKRLYLMLQVLKRHYDRIIIDTP